MRENVFNDLFVLGTFLYASQHIAMKRFEHFVESVCRHPANPPSEKVGVKRPENRRNCIVTDISLRTVFQQVEQVRLRDTRVEQVNGA